MLKIILMLSLMFPCASLVLAGDLSDDVEKTLYFGVIPQQSSKKISQRWQPLINRLSAETGLDIQLKRSLNIGVFESQLLSGQFDIAYTNPLLYLSANRSLGYRAIAKETNKKLKGIIVVRKNDGINSLDDLKGKNIVFPENAFAATALTQLYLNREKLEYNASFVFSHDAGYKFLSLGKYSAAAGVTRTFNAMNIATKSRLKILKEFKGVTPHPFAVHPRLSNETVQKIQRALVNVNSDNAGKRILKKLNFNPLGEAHDTEWDDVRAIMNMK